MNEPIKHSKEYLRAQHETERRTQKELDKLAEKQSFELLCQELDAIIKDNRYKGYKFLLEARLQNARICRDNLRNTIKTNDEYLRLGLILDTEISVLRDILEIPNRFADKLKEIQNQGGNTNA